jgi:glycosyltransferase involved in cell wall biosynthesis
MKLTVIIPIYNEASTLATLLERVRAVDVDKQIIVVDDGSDGETKDELRQALTNDIVLLTHRQNRGKGTAIRTALAQADGDVVIIQDADLEYFPEDYTALLEVYSEKGAGAVYGVRDLSHRSRLMRYGNRAMTLATNILYGHNLQDMETCYKLIDRRLFQSLELQSRRFEIEAEITAKLLRSGVHIFEAPIRYEHREEGKKLTPMDGLPTLAKLITCRTWRPNRQWDAAEERASASQLPNDRG